MTLPSEIRNRIATSAPQGLSIVEHSLPIVSFGDAFTAKVATISLNPSWKEFRSDKQEWLEGSARRVHSLHSLGVQTADQLTDELIEKAYDSNAHYFDKTRGANPYMTWFSQLNAVLKPCLGADYTNGTACHLDLVQWATYPAQGQLPRATWDALVAADSEFLRWQMKSTSANVFVMNGAGAINELQRVGIVPGLEVITVPFQNSLGHDKAFKIMTGRDSGKIYIGWNQTISFGIPGQVREPLLAAISRAAV
jgi:hypothetical protein